MSQGPPHNIRAWIIICSLRAEQSIKTLKEVALFHPGDDDAPEIVNFFSSTDLNASKMADDFAGIGHRPQPSTVALNRSEKLEFWGGRAAQAIDGLGQAAVSVLEQWLIPPTAEEAYQAIELFERTENEATRLTMAVSTRD